MTWNRGPIDVKIIENNYIFPLNREREERLYWNIEEHERNTVQFEEYIKRKYADDKVNCH